MLFPLPGISLMWLLVLYRPVERLHLSWQQQLSFGTTLKAALHPYQLVVTYFICVLPLAHIPCLQAAERSLCRRPKLQKPAQCVTAGGWTASVTVGPFEKQNNSC
jgi:hypothetical protein